MICLEEMTTCDVEAADTDPLVHPGDRFIVSKLIKPQRWDIIAFRYPVDPSVNEVKRLVGLPGETVEIDDGAVWIDGKRLTPPAPFERLHYVDEIDGGRWGPKLWGTRLRPAKLGDDECFVLGDFSERSGDSRLWEVWSPDHPSYAVPESYIKGVVTHIYAPCDRLRAFR
jgi:signal peptidase I